MLCNSFLFRSHIVMLQWQSSKSWVNIKVLYIHEICNSHYAGNFIKQIIFLIIIFFIFLKYSSFGTSHLSHVTLFDPTHSPNAKALYSADDHRKCYVQSRAHVQYQGQLTVHHMATTYSATNHKRLCSACTRLADPIWFMDRSSCRFRHVP